MFLFLSLILSVRNICQIGSGVYGSKVSFSWTDFKGFKSLKGYFCETGYFYKSNSYGSFSA